MCSSIRPARSADQGGMDKLTRGSDRIATKEGLYGGVGVGVGVLDRGGLHEVGGGRHYRAADAAVRGDLGGADGIDDHTGGVGGVPDLQFVLHIQRDVAEGATFQADVGPFAV